MAALPKFDYHKGPEGRKCGRLLVSGVTSSLGIVVDISASGARIVTPRHPGLKSGQSMMISLHSDPTGTFGVRATLVRSWKTGFFKHTCAFHFEDPPQDVKKKLGTLAQTCGKGAVEWTD